MKVPASYDAARPSPLVLFLHGYGSTGARHASFFALGAVAESERVIVAAPDGRLNSDGSRFWNAVPSCCDFEATGVDDVAYLRAVITDLRGKYNIDSQRIYAVGHSNGGAMALRMACDAADTVAAVVELAGPFYTKAEACKPSEPVAVRVLHGTADNVVPFAGGMLPQRIHTSKERPPTSSARFKADTFAALNGCNKQPVAKPDADYLNLIGGARIGVQVFPDCKADAAVELWTLNDAGHILLGPNDWKTVVWDFLAAHPKPSR